MSYKSTCLFPFYNIENNRHCSIATCSPKPKTFPLLASLNHGSKVRKKKKPVSKKEIFIRKMPGLGSLFCIHPHMDTIRILRCRLGAGVGRALKASAVFSQCSSSSLVFCSVSLPIIVSLSSPLCLLN